MEELLRDYFNACMDRDVDRIAETKKKLSKELRILEEKAKGYEELYRIIYNYNPKGEN